MLRRGSERRRLQCVFFWKRNVVVCVVLRVRGVKRGLHENKGSCPPSQNYLVENANWISQLKDFRASGSS